MNTVIIRAATHQLIIDSKLEQHKAALLLAFDPLSLCVKVRASCALSWLSFTVRAPEPRQPDCRRL